MLPLRDENPTTRRPVVTVALMLVCVAVYFAIQPNADDVEGLEFSYRYAAIPCEVVSGEPLSLDELDRTLRGDDSACGVERESSPPLFPDKNVFAAVLSSMFLHGGLLHLGGNMLFLWVFGNNIEDHLGHARYLLFYLAAGAAATVTHIAVDVDSTVPIVGASGAIAGVMGAYLVWFPRARIRVLVFLGILVLFPRIPAWAMLGFWFLSQFMVSATDRVAWMAHVGGFAAGVAVGLAVRESVAARRWAWTPDHRDHGGGAWDPVRGGRW